MDAARSRWAPNPSRWDPKCTTFPTEGGVMMRPRTFGAAACAGALLVLLGAAFQSAAAQSAVITGKVVGRQGEALAGAIVVIDDLDTPVATTPAGSYTLAVAPHRTHR